MKMQNGKIVKFSVKDSKSGELRDVTGIVLGNDDWSTKIMMTTGAKSDIENTEIQKSEEADDITDEMRGVLENYYSMYAKWSEKLKESKKLSMEADVLEEEMMAAAHDIPRASGQMTTDEFSQYLLSIMPDDLKDAMEKYGYRVSAKIFAFGIFLHISRIELISRYLRRASFLYEEYDGEIAFIRDREKNDEYRGILKEHSCPLPITWEADESLELEDKGWLTYYETYEIKIDSLTQDTAKRLVESMQKKD